MASNNVLKLYSYYRSSAAYRVRIALNLKCVHYTTVPIHLLRDGGEHRQASYISLNPQALVPTLEHDSLTLIQSLAILEYLEETYPSPPLLPVDSAGRAHVRAIALTIACDIHPLNNLRVLQYLQEPVGLDESTRKDWYNHWIHAGFTAIETLINSRRQSAPYCYGATPTLADCCLIPQVYNALRFHISMNAYPSIARIYYHCVPLEAFRLAAPENQPDHE